MTRGRSYHQVVSANQLALPRQLGVDLCMNSRYIGCEVQSTHPRDDGFNKRGSSITACLAVRPMDAHQQFRDGYDADEHFRRLLPRCQVNGLTASLEGNEDVRINDQSHGL